MKEDAQDGVKWRSPSFTAGEYAERELFVRHETKKFTTITTHYRKSENLSVYYCVTKDNGNYAKACCQPITQHNY